MKYVRYTPVHDTTLVYPILEPLKETIVFHPLTTMLYPSTILESSNGCLQNVTGKCFLTYFKNYRKTSFCFP